MGTSASLSIQRVLNNCSSPRPGGANRPEDGPLSDFFKSLYIEIKKDRWGKYAVVAGTRTSVATIARYAQMGYDAHTIATEILPHLTPAQVHSAMAYYFEHREAVEAEIAADTMEVWQARLKELVGEEAYKELVGTADS